MIVKRVRKEVEVFAESMGISTKALRESRRKRDQADAEKGKDPAKTESASLATSSSQTRSPRIFVPLYSHAMKSTPAKDQVKVSSERKKDISIECMQLSQKMRILNLMKKLEK